MSLQTLIDAELTTLVADGRSYPGSTPMVAVKDLSVLAGEGMPGYLACLAPSILVWQPDRAVVLRTCHGPSLWVDCASDRYRDDFAAYAETFRQLPVHLVHSGLDVDHLYNRARARHFGFKYLRVFPVMAAANRQHGSSYEKSSGISERNRDNSKHVKLLDEMSFLKVRGVPALGPGGALTAAHHSYANWVNQHFGIDVQEVLKGLQNLQTRAYDWRF